MVPSTPAEDQPGLHGLRKTQYNALDSIVDATLDSVSDFDDVGSTDAEERKAKARVARASKLTPNERRTRAKASSTEKRSLLADVDVLVQ